MNLDNKELKELFELANKIGKKRYHRLTEELELIYFIMPAPRKITEVAYAAILFASPIPRPS